MQMFPIFHNWAILLFSEIVHFYKLIGYKILCCPIRSVIILVINKSESRCADFVITLTMTDRIGLQSVLLPLLNESNILTQGEIWHLRFRLHNVHLTET